MIAHPPTFLAKERTPGAARDRSRIWAMSLCAVAWGLAAYSVYRMATLTPGDPRPQPTAWLDLEEPGTPIDRERAEAPSQPDSLRIGVAPVLSPEVSSGMYEGLFEFLGRRAGRKPVVVHGKSYGDINKLVRYRQCELASICVFAAVRGEEEFGMEVLAVPVVRGSLEFHSLIVVQAESPAHSLLDLRDQRFASCDLLSATGWLYPVIFLQEHGQDPAAFFSRHVITGSHDRSLRAVSKDCVEGAAVDSLVYEYVVEEEPAIASKVRVIGRSPAFGTPPFVVHPALEPDIKNELREALLHMHEDEEGRAALEAARIDRFVEAPEGFYDSVRSLVSRLDSE